MKTPQDYSGKRVLVTGGTGSFGKTVAKHLLVRGVEEVRVLSRDEAKQHDMRVLFDERQSCKDFQSTPCAWGVL